MISQILIVIFLTIALAVLIAIVYALIAWARKRSTGATVAGAAMIGMGMGGDPALEEQLRVVQEAEEKAPEEDESGAPKE